MTERTTGSGHEAEKQAQQATQQSKLLGTLKSGHLSSAFNDKVGAAQRHLDLKASASAAFAKKEENQLAFDKKQAEDKLALEKKKALEKKGPKLGM